MYYINTITFKEIQLVAISGLIVSYIEKNEIKHMPLALFEAIYKQI